MGKRKIYKITYNIPLYAAWKCFSCGETNFADIDFVYSAVTSRSLVQSVTPIERKIIQYTDKRWKKRAIDVICDPVKNYRVFRRSLRMEECNCQNCYREGKWNKALLKKAVKNNMLFLGSENPELIQFAEENGYKLLTPQEALKRASSQNKSVDV